MKPSFRIENIGQITTIHSGVHSQGKDPLVGRHIQVQSRPGGVIGIAPHVVGGGDIPQQLTVVDVEEEPPLVVAGDSPLTAELRLLSNPPLSHPTISIGRTGVVDPVIQAQHQSIGGMFNAPPSIVRIDQRHLIGLAIAVDIPREIELMLGDEEQSIRDRKTGSRERQAIEKPAHPLVAPVLIEILQERNPRNRFLLSSTVKVLHKTPQLDDVKPPQGIKTKRNGILDERLPRNQLEMEPGYQFGPFHRFSSGVNRRCGRIGNPIGTRGILNLPDPRKIRLGDELIEMLDETTPG